MHVHDHHTQKSRTRAHPDRSRLSTKHVRQYRIFGTNGNSTNTKDHVSLVKSADWDEATSPITLLQMALNWQLLSIEASPPPPVDHVLLLSLRVPKEVTEVSGDFKGDDVIVSECMLLSKSDPTDLRTKLFVPLSQRDRCRPNCVDFSLDVLRNIICNSKDESSTDRVCWGSVF